jgi:acyl transferase domain-containing protein
VFPLVLSTGGHYLKEDVPLFDAPCFALPVNEAPALNAQQRHLLETTYLALKNGTQLYNHF